MQKNWIFSLVFLAASHVNAAPSEKHSAIQESLTLRRISEYWKEGDLDAVKTQVRDFLTKRLASSYSDQLYAILGDIYFHENNYADALGAYDQISGQLFQDKVRRSRLHCLYRSARWADAITCAKAFLKEERIAKEDENTARFEMADSYYRLALQTDNQAAKKTLFQEALNHYKVLHQTHFSDHTLYPLAEIYTFFNDHEKAVDVFLKLADQYPDQQEEFLFQAASLQTDFNRTKAIDTFGKIYRLNGAYAPQAAYNQLNLMFQDKQYKELLSVHEEALKHISSEYLPLMHFFIGKSLFALSNYSQAIVPLKLFASSPHAEKSQIKSALLSLTSCAYETKDLSLFDQTLNHLKHDFANDSETANAILLHSQLCREKSDLKRAKADLKEIANSFPYHPKRDAILYDHALLLTQCSEWEEAVAAFTDYLNAYPNSSKKSAALRHLAFSAIEDVKLSTPVNLAIKREELVNTLSLALKCDEAFTPNEKQQIHYLLGKTHFELSQYDEALDKLSEYALDFPKDPHTASAHLMMAYCHLRGSQDLLLFAIEAEKALRINPQLKESESLHIQLYNAYLELAQQTESDGKEHVIQQAADHLFLALNGPVKRENQLWLANYCYRQFQASSGDELEFFYNRSVAVLEKLLGINGPRFQFEITADTLDMEAEAIKLSDLYLHAKRYSDRARLLQALHKCQMQNPEWDWKYQRLALFELAKSYEWTGDTQRALETYDYLIHSSSHSSSYFGIAARLNRALLQYGLIASTANNTADVQPILDQLKDLEIKRRLATEPLHLEAAINYIEIKAALAPEEEQLARTLALVQQAHSNLTDLQDPLVQHYFAAKERFSEQMQTFQHYMQYLSAEELRLKGMLALKIHDTFQAKEFKMKALVQLDTLLCDTLPDSLQKRIQLSREALNQDL